MRKKLTKKKSPTKKRVSAKKKRATSPKKATGKKDYAALSIAAHQKHRGKLSVECTMPIKNKDDLSIAYTPGVAAPSLEIAKDISKARDFTTAKNTVAIISDGSAVLGLGDIGPQAALPVMEGKAALLKRFAGINGFPIVLSERTVDGIITAVKAIAPTFGAINLEDISAPRCFEIERRLAEELDIPVMHDDQHGTAVVVLAGLMNALTLTKRKKEDTVVVIAGAGAAGIATAKLLRIWGIQTITMIDRKGIISHARNELNPTKRELLAFTNPEHRSGSLSDALTHADVFIGLSQPNTLLSGMIARMHQDPIIFALANPTPEIMPEDAHRAGASVVATGRSDFPNQINNSLAFPGIYKGLIEGRLTKVTDTMKVAAAYAIAGMVKKPTPERIVPGAFDKDIAEMVSRAVRRATLS